MRSGSSRGSRAGIRPDREPPDHRAVTIFSPAISQTFEDRASVAAGGAEHQVELVAKRLTDQGVLVRLLTINSSGKEGDRFKGIEVMSAWHSGQSLPGKVWGLVKSVLASPGPIYVRASRPTIENVVVVILGRLSRRRVLVGLASDLMCVRHRALTPTWLRTRTILRLATSVNAQTAEQARLLKRVHGVNAATIANYVSVRRFGESRVTPFSSRDIDVVWIGSIVPEKGLDRLIGVAAGLEERSIAIIGGSPPRSEVHLPALQRRAASLRNVRLTGRVAPGDVPGWLARSRVLLHTSQPIRDGLTKEGFPNVMLEAWAAGVPVVSMGVDPDGLISHGGLGFIGGTVDEAVQAIRRILTDQPLWLTIRERAIAFAESRDINSKAWDAFASGLLRR